jgi:hypothetical protein
VFVHQGPGVVNCDDCYFAGGDGDDQTGTVNFHGCWAVPSEWTNWADADSVLTKPILRIRKQTDLTTMTGSIKDCRMSFGMYTGNWQADGTFNAPVDMVQDPTATGGRGRINHWSQRETRLILDVGGTTDDKIVKQGGTGAIIRQEYQPGTGGLVTVDYISNAMRVSRASGGGRLDLGAGNQSGLDFAGTDLRLFNGGASQVAVQNNGILRPAADNTQALGSASFRWSEVFAGTGTINTSDARAKQDVRELSEAERAVASRIRGLIRAYRFTDAVAQKGDGARTHFGLIAQDVAAAFDAEGLDPLEYGIVCYDEWPETPALIDEATGEVLEPSRPAGDRWGLRYDELMAFLIAVS